LIYHPVAVEDLICESSGRCKQTPQTSIYKSSYSKTTYVRKLTVPLLLLHTPLQRNGQTP